MTCCRGPLQVKTGMFAPSFDFHLLPDQSDQPTDMSSKVRASNFKTRNSKN
jgi:hypothetical protein